MNEEDKGEQNVQLTKIDIKNWLATIQEIRSKLIEHDNILDSYTAQISELRTEMENTKKIQGNILLQLGLGEGGLITDSKNKQLRKPPQVVNGHSKIYRMFCLQCISVQQIIHGQVTYRDGYLVMEGNCNGCNNTLWQRIAP